MTIVFQVSPLFSYYVVLMFSENYCTTVGCRVGNYVVNGVTCLSSFDIYQHAGTATAYNVRCPQNVTGVSTVTIGVTSVAASAQINALQILPQGTTSNYPYTMS